MLQLGYSDALIGHTVEVIRSNYWSLRLAGPGNLGSLPDLEGFSLRDLPNIGHEQEVIEHTPINNTVGYPGKQRASSTQMRLIMLENDPVYMFFMRWRRLCYDPVNHVAGLLSEIAGYGSISIYTSAGSGASPVEVRRIQLELVWPSSLIVSGMNRDTDGEPLEYQVKLEIGNSYDTAL